MVQEIKRYRTANGFEFDTRAEAELHEAKAALITSIDKIIGTNENWATEFITAVETDYDFEHVVQAYIGAWSVVRAIKNQQRQLVKDIPEAEKPYHGMMKPKLKPNPDDQPTKDWSQT